MIKFKFLTVFFIIFQVYPDLTNLPLIVWERILKDLKFRDINNLHLASKNFHNISNFLVSHKLNLGKVISTDSGIEAFKASSRFYSEIKLRNFDLSDSKLNEISETLRKFGSEVKHLEFFDVSISKFAFLKLLKVLPNLETISIVNVSMLMDFEICINEFSGDENSKNVTLKKLKHLEIKNCCPGFYTVLDYFKGCAINQADFISIEDSEAQHEVMNIVSFLKSQETSLKSLTLIAINHDDWPLIFESFKEMRLELLDLCMDFGYNSEPFLNFLKTQTEMNFFGFASSELPNNLLSLICENLKDLETLELNVDGFGWNTCNDIWKLRKLKRLEISNEISFEHNVLVGLLNNTCPISEFETSFDHVNSEFLYQLSKTFPNLNKLTLKLKTNDQKKVEDILFNFSKINDLTIEFCEDLKRPNYGKILSSINVFGRNLKSLYFEASLKESMVRVKLNKLQGLKFGCKDYNIDI